MQRAVFIFSVLMMSASLNAQDANSYLSSASENVKAKKYQRALQDMDKAKKAVKDLLGQQLAAALPAAVGKWKMSEDKDGDMAMMGGGMNGVNVTQVYKNPDLQPAGNQEEDMPENMPAPNDYGQGGRVSVTISNNVMSANEVMMAHSGQEMYDDGRMQTEVLRVKGYRALSRFNEENQSGSLTVIAGAGVIKIELQGVDDPNTLNEFAEAVNYDTVKSVLGE